MCRLLARVASQRRSVPCAELAAVKAGSEHRHGGSQMHAEVPLRRVCSANAARMSSSPKHTPLRVRLRPGGPEPEVPLDGRVRSAAHGGPPQRGQLAGLVGPNAGRGARPGGSARSGTELIPAMLQTPRCLLERRRTDDCAISGGLRPWLCVRRVRLFSSFQTLNTYLRRS